MTMLIVISILTAVWIAISYLTFRRGWIYGYGHGIAATYREHAILVSMDVPFTREYLVDMAEAWSTPPKPTTRIGWLREIWKHPRRIQQDGDALLEAIAEAGRKAAERSLRIRPEDID